MPRIVQRGRQEPDVAWLLYRVVEVKRVTTVSKTMLLYNIVSKHTIYKMYQRHSFGVPPPIFTPPPAPYNPIHRAYATGKQPTSTQAVVPPQVVVPHQDVVPQQDGGFPSQLSLLQQDKPQPVPAVSFSDSITQSVADIFNKEMNIYVTPTDYFTTKFRQIFTKTQIKFTTAKYARKWLAKPDMSFWPQQLNFALWCATTGCGVSREMLFPNSSLNLSEQVRTFYQFHVYYTTRKILYEMGGIQSKNALPDDPAFKQQENPYDDASYKRICGEFGIDPSTDFCFTYGQNHELGYVNIMYADRPFAHKLWQYPPADLSNPSSQRLKGDSGTTNNNTIAFIRNDQGADKQFEPNHSSGLTLNGLGRINRSIKAFGYCILGAQANTRTSILGNLGTARNTQTDFLVLIEDALKTLTVSNAPVKYQNAIEATKVRLNFAVARGVLLLPARMIINTESVVGYNNNLRRATDDMKLGVTNHVNQGTHKASLKLMVGGPSKVKPPNSHPANPGYPQTGNRSPGYCAHKGSTGNHANSPTTDNHRHARGGAPTDTRASGCGPG